MQTKNPNLPRQPITNAEIAGDYDWCIAGGFACCPGMARDCDVWVLGVTLDGSMPEDVRGGILDRLTSAGVQFEPEENDPEQPGEIYNLGNGILCWKVAKLDDGRQIILTNAETPYDLLQSFDVSTHQVALSSNGELVKGADWTPPTMPPVMIWNGGTTSERIVKISRRYGRMRPTPPIVEPPLREESQAEAYDWAV